MFVEIKVLSCVSESRAIFLFVILIFGAPFNFFIYFFGGAERRGLLFWWRGYNENRSIALHRVWGFGVFSCDMVSQELTNVLPFGFTCNT